MGKQLSFSIARRVHAKQSRRVGAARISGRPRKQQKPTQLQLGESQPHQLPVQVITVFRYSRHTCQIRQTGSCPARVHPDPATRYMHRPERLPAISDPQDRYKPKYPHQYEQTIAACLYLRLVHRHSCCLMCRSRAEPPSRSLA